MALAVFFLLTGTLAAEFSLLGAPLVGYAGAALLFLSTFTLLRLWWAGYPGELEPMRAEFRSLSPQLPRN
jgi:hypothetical protein